MSKSARRAQKVTLGAAVFDKHGRILVDPDGVAPSAVITDSFLEKVLYSYLQAVESALTIDSMPRRDSTSRTPYFTGCSKHPAAGPRSHHSLPA